MKTQIVTKEWLAGKLTKEGNRTPECNRVIGRALAAIYRRQTDQEKGNTRTINANGIGFSKPDARVGSIGARMFLAHGCIASWVEDIWMRLSPDGLPRICKYAGQLNEIAEARQLATTRNTNEKVPRTAPLAIS